MANDAVGHGGGYGVAALVWVVLGAGFALYLWAAHRRQGARRGWSRWRTASCTAGIVLLAAAVAPPLSRWAHHDLSGHMVQHLLIGMFAPLALVLAAPGTLLLRSLPVVHARRVTALLRSSPARVLSHPATALLLDVGVLYLLYLTPLFAATQASPALHHVVHLHFFAAGYLFCWAVAGPDPAPHRPGHRVRLAALFLAIAAHSTLAKVMYAYGWPRGAGFAAEEIERAARLMYYGGDLAELLLAVALFASWHRHTGRTRRRTAGRPPPSSALDGPPRRHYVARANGCT